MADPRRSGELLVTRQRKTMADPRRSGELLVTRQRKTC